MASRKSREGPKGKPRGIRHDRDCLTCKRRQVKCDLNRPSCQACIGANLRCEGYALNIKWITNGKGTGGVLATTPCPPMDPVSRAHGNHSTAATLLQNSPPSSSTDSEQDSNWTSNITGYLRYFTVKLDQSRLSHDHENTNLDILEAGDLSDVWIFAWKHIEHNFRQGRNSDVDDQLLHITALNALGRAVKARHIFAIFGITTFAFLDVREGPFGGWERHLRGARALLDVHCSSALQFKEVCEQTPGLQQAISLLNWYDVMGAIVHDKRDLIFEDWHREYMDDTLFDLVGCPRETFQLYVTVADGRIPENMQESYHLAMFQLLKLDSNHADEQSPLRDGWRLGAVLAAMFILKPESDLIGLIADKICSVIESVGQEHEEVYVHLAVIVYLTGVCGTTSRHESMVRRYWAFFNSRAIPEYPNAQELCDKARVARHSRA